MFVPRDLIAEKDEAKLAVKVLAMTPKVAAPWKAKGSLAHEPPWKAGPPTQPMQPIGAPPASLAKKRTLPSLKEQFEAVVAEPCLSVAQGLVVEIGEDDYTNLKTSLDGDELVKASHVAGVYWLVGEGPGGKPVYKNPANDLLLFFIEGAQQGWYIAIEFFESHKDAQRAPGAIYAWMGAGEQPSDVHVPCWEKKALKADGSGVKTIVQFHTDRIFYILCKL